MSDNAPEPNPAQAGFRKPMTIPRNVYDVRHVLDSHRYDLKEMELTDSEIMPYNRLCLERKRSQLA